MIAREASRKRLGQDLRLVRLMSLLLSLPLVSSDDLPSSKATLHKSGCLPHPLAVNGNSRLNLTSKDIISVKSAHQFRSRTEDWITHSRSPGMFRIFVRRHMGAQPLKPRESWFLAEHPKPRQAASMPRSTLPTGNDTPVLSPEYEGGCQAHWDGGEEEGAVVLGGC